MAWGDKYVSEAKESAKIASTQYPTCLITREQWSSELGFDKVIVGDFSKVEHLQAYCQKWICFEQTPFETTLVLDSDARPVGDISMAFRMANKFGFAIAFASGQTLHSRGIEYPHYCGGTYAWSGVRSDLLSLFMRYRNSIEDGHYGDEAAMSVAIQDSGMRHSILPPIYSIARAGKIHTKKIRVFHTRSFHDHYELEADEHGNEIPLRLIRR